MNTKFFQNQCKHRKHWNTIRELKYEDGTVIQGQTNISSEVRNFFEHLYNAEEPTTQRLMEDMVSDIPSLISPEEKIRLESPISEEV